MDYKRLLISILIVAGIICALLVLFWLVIEHAQLIVMLGLAIKLVYQLREKETDDQDN